jgi:hypothetical protein
MPSNIRTTIIVVAAVLLLSLPAIADRTPIRPGWNLFTTQQDVEMGRALASDAESTLPLLGTSDATTYLDALGSQLAAHTTGERYSYQFKIIDDDATNAFALPGGYIYISRGAIEAAENEPQLAGLLAHEIAHVVLRHGTQQVSSVYADRQTNATRGRVSVPTAMSRLNLRFENNSPALKYTREMERQADIVGAQIMRDSSFDPRQMTRMFQNIVAEPQRMTADFFQNHPNLTNRAALVRTEMQNMGGLPSPLRGDSNDFHSVKNMLETMTTDSDYYPSYPNTGNRPDWPSARLVNYRGSDLNLRYPDNWAVDEETEAVVLAPDGGYVDGSLAYGIRISSFQPRQTRYFGESGLVTPGDRAQRSTLSSATDQLIAQLQRSNPNMRVSRSMQSRTVAGEAGLAVELSNDSPIGGREVDWLVTSLRPNGTLRYFIGVAPQRDIDRYMPTFEQILNSVRFYD